MLLFLNSHVVWTLMPVAVSMARVIVHHVRVRMERRRNMSTNNFAAHVRAEPEPVRCADRANSPSTQDRAKERQRVAAKDAVRSTTRLTVGPG